MHHKKIFALAGVFLAVALVAAPVILYFEGVSELVVYENQPIHQTGGNLTFPEQIQQSRMNAYILVAVVEAVFVLLFVVTMYYGINHLPHTGGKIKPGKNDDETESI
jgi:hypothetical protein